MRIPRISSVKSEDQARNIALDWQVWQQDNSMYMSEVIEWQEFFEAIGKRFNLTDEFKENGII